MAAKHFYHLAILSSLKVLITSEARWFWSCHFHFSNFFQKRRFESSKVGYRAAERHFFFLYTKGKVWKTSFHNQKTFGENLAYCLNVLKQHARVFREFPVSTIIYNLSLSWLEYFVFLLHYDNLPQWWNYLKLLKYIKS